MAVVLAALAAPAAAQAGGDPPAPPSEGGAQYGTPIVRARPARPVARYFRVGPGLRRRPRACPSSPCASTRRAPTRSGRAIVFMPQTETGSIVRIDLGRIPVGQRVVATWPRARRSRPGATACCLHVRGLRGTVLARKASTPGRATLTVRAPAPAPAPLPDPAGHVFPVGGPHSFGDAFGAPRNGYSHQGQDISPPRACPSSPRRGHDLLHRLPGQGRRLLHRREGRRRLRLLLRPLPEGARR